MDRDALIDRYNDIERQLEAFEYNPCECDQYLELKVRYFGNGKHYVYQCNNCGEQRGGSIKKVEAQNILNGVAPNEFDPSIEEISRKAYKVELDKRMVLHEEMRRIKEHFYGTESSSFNEHKEKIDKYKLKLTNLVNEMSEELGNQVTERALMSMTVNLKKNDYLENIKKTNRFESEEELKKWLVNFLSCDFELYPEINGIHISENVNVRIDYIAKPKPHLISNGFAPEPFGIEVKYFKQENQFTHKTSRAFWQTISYNDCQFYLNGVLTKLNFSLLFSNLAFKKEMNLVRNYGLDVENDQMEWKGMLHIANHAKVGTIVINGDKSYCSGWRIKFAGGTYFSGVNTENGMQYSLSNNNVINKLRIGNF